MQFMRLLITRVICIFVFCVIWHLYLWTWICQIVHWCKYRLPQKRKLKGSWAGAELLCRQETSRDIGRTETCRFTSQVEQKSQFYNIWYCACKKEHLKILKPRLDWHDGVEFLYELGYHITWQNPTKPHKFLLSPFLNVSQTQWAIYLTLPQ
jgi:hypothetical protein